MKRFQLVERVLSCCDYRSSEVFKGVPDDVFRAVARKSLGVYFPGMEFLIVFLPVQLATSFLFFGVFYAFMHNHFMIYLAYFLLFGVFFTVWCCILSSFLFRRMRRILDREKGRKRGHP